MCVAGPSGRPASFLCRDGVPLCLPSADPVPPSKGTAGPEQLLNCPTGSYEYYFDTGELRWSDEMYRIHGYRRGEMVPSLESGFPYVPAEEQEGCAPCGNACSQTEDRLPDTTRSVDRRGRRHRVLSVGDLIVDAGSVVGVRGMVTDLTEPVDRNTRRATARPWPIRPGTGP
jgi:hypothetical protein